MESTETKNNVCIKCGAELEADSLFCSVCGAKQEPPKEDEDVVNVPAVAPMAVASVQQPQEAPPHQPQSAPQQPHIPPQPQMQAQPQPQMVVAQAPKNMILALLLAALFGPLGLLYATIPGGLIMLCVFIVLLVILTIFTLGLGFFLPFFIVSPTCVLWAYMATEKYNERLMNGQPPAQRF